MARRNFWGDGDLAELLNRDLIKALELLEKLSPTLILDAEPTELISQIVNDVSRQELKLDWESVTKSQVQEETMTGVDMLNRPMKSVGRSIEIFVPVMGDTTLLRYQPNTVFDSPPLWKIDTAQLVLKIADANLTKEHVESEFKRSKQAAINAVSRANQQLHASLTEISGQVNSQLQRRRANLEKAAKLDEEIDLS